MHEASIALSILDIVEDRCKRTGYTKVDSIEVSIGCASSVLPEALMFAFEIAKTGTIASGATLVINHVRLGGTCRGCGGEFQTDDAFILECPSCGGKDFTIEKGRELDITAMEVN